MMTTASQAVPHSSSHTTQTVPPPALTTVLDLWKAHKASLTHTIPSAAAALVPIHFAHDASVVCVPTAAGGEEIKEIETFIRTLVEQQNAGNAVMEEKVLSRIVDVDEGRASIAEESVVTIVHDAVVDWLLPDVKPTRRRVAIPMTTFVTFTAEPKIQTKRVYWDQGSVMKQIGLLPNSVYCKANTTETTLPVLGPKIVDRLLLDAEHATANLILKERRLESGVAGIVSGKEPLLVKAQAHEPAHGIIPQHEDDVDTDTLRLAQIKRQNRLSASFALPVEENNIVPSSAPLPQQAARPSREQTTNFLTDDAPRETQRSSTRIHHEQANRTSNIFGDDPVPLRTSVPIDARRFKSSFSFGNEGEGEAAPAHNGERRHLSRPNTAAAGNDSRVDQAAKHLTRRDPNWSSADGPTVRETTDNASISGKKTFGNKHSADHFIDTAVSSTSSSSSVNGDDPSVLAAGKKHFGPADQTSHFALGLTPLTHSELQRPHIGGKKHSQRANDDNDIFGHHDADLHTHRRHYAPGGSERVALAAAAEARDGEGFEGFGHGFGGKQERPRTARRDPNARSVESEVVKPSSRVLRPPGGGQSFTFG
ncbi:uncharacterized protein EV422DRAFT_66664 [Fimicolochytrium jonesii]|uniref:uncharacterized protein n=1 Tax=Fimicolochytrium jonesii TaxID=1396493 RepID=UPI0022FE0E2F|nr:uncharacterized protein EV422DRAFT_66664 [Fimicolochytrium jonesii]KAI8820869.1 hypothetical protein EV422DRAFT_66664 [Fimicolochytrium jonesii]